MPRPTMKTVIVVGLLALLGWNVHVRLAPDEDLNVVDHALLAATGPVQRGLASTLRATRRGLAGYTMLLGVRAENEALRTELLATRASVAELHEVRAENDRLRELAGLRGRAPGTTLGVSVIGRGTSARFRTVRIDRGTDDGVLPGMAVLATEGAAGRVLRASGRYSDVLLLTDGLSAVGAVVQRSRLRTVAAGVGATALELGFVGRSDLHLVSVGDLLVTSGEDGVFPEGVPLGVVTSAHAPETGLFLDVEVTPSVPLDRVEELLVVIDGGVGPRQLLPEPSQLVAPQAGVEGEGTALHPPGGDEGEEAALQIGTSP